MRVFIISGTTVNGRAAYAGQVVETDDRSARTLIAAGHAVPAPAAPPGPELATASAPEAAIADAQQRTRGRRKAVEAP